MKPKLTLALVTALALTGLALPALAESPADLNDAQMAHVAYVADTIDIKQAHLALALSDNADVRAFAETMIADHTAVNDQALALLKAGGVDLSGVAVDPAAPTGVALIGVDAEGGAVVIPREHLFGVALRAGDGADIAARFAGAI